MRIVQLTSGVRGIGSYTYNISKYLEAQGHDVLFITEAEWHKQKVKGFYQAKSKMMFGLAPLVTDVKGLLKQITDFNPDIVHFHWPCSTMDILFGRLRKTVDAPIFVTLHCAVASFKQMFDKVWYIHFGGFKKWLKTVQGVNSISVFIQEQCKRRIDLPEEMHHLIYAGISDDIFKPLPKEKGDTLNVLFVGQVMPEKGIDNLVKAVVKASEKISIKLSVVGTGHLFDKLKEQTKGKDCINWVGFVGTQQEIAEYYAKADVLCLPTRWDEAFSLVPVEAMACGTPVIATRRGGSPEIVFPDKTGYLLEEGDVDEIYNTLMSLDRKKLHAMGKTCRDHALKNFSLEKFGKDHEKVYKQLVNAYKKKQGK